MMKNKYYRNLNRNMYHAYGVRHILPISRNRHFTNMPAFRKTIEKVACHQKQDVLQLRGFI